jgi:hypothetical protein
MRNIKNWSFVALFAVLITGCSKDFLNKPPQDAIPAQAAYGTDDQVLAATALLYSSVWQDYNQTAAFNLADFRGGDVTKFYASPDNIWFSTTAGTGDNGTAWKAFYNVVGQSNTAISNINQYAGAAVSAAVKNQAIGEARFMRALAYRHLVMLWGAVPIITDNVSLFANPTSVKANTVQSVWKFITSEMRQAATELPETAAAGRVTKWSAEGMLARFYLSRAGVESTGGQRNQQFLDSAKYYAKEVITSSGKTLATNYRDLFLYTNSNNYNNNNESLFELQWTYVPSSDPSNTWSAFANTTISQINPDGSIANGDGWGADNGATMWMMSLYDGFTWTNNNDTLSLKGRTIDKRLHETFMLPGFSYPELTRVLGTQSQNPFVYPNNTFGSSFDGNVSTGWSAANIKKYVIGGKSTNGIMSDKSDYPNNTYMLRLAEMYLIYAEAALGNNTSTTDQTALDYFNAIHTRAGLPAYDVSREGPLTYDQIFKEKMVEFGSEAMAWYILVDLHYWSPQKAYDIINAQDRGIYYIKVDKFPDPTIWTFVRSSDRRYATANDGNFMLPLPATEVTQAPNLLDPPVDYYAQ